MLGGRWLRTIKAIIFKLYVEDDWVIKPIILKLYLDINFSDMEDDLTIRTILTLRRRWLNG